MNNSPYSKPSKELYKQSCEEILKPIPSARIEGFNLFQKITNGFRPREFSILCGATGVGKTTLLANFSFELLSSGISHFVASVETGATDFMKRVMSVSVDDDLNTGDAVSIERVRRVHELHATKFQSENLWLSLYDNRFSVEQLISDIDWHVKNKGCKIAMIDNLNFFMEVTSASNQIIEMDRVIHNLIIYCKQADVHIIMVMHPKKTDHGRVESEFDIKGSSTAVQEAHNVFLFNRPSKDLIQNNQASIKDRELKIAKMRRKGSAVGARIIFQTANGVKYSEVGVYES